MGPRIRNGISRRLVDIAVLVQSNSAFLTFIDLCLQGQIVSDYHPLISVLMGFLQYYYDIKIFWIHYFFYLRLVLVSMNPKIQNKGI